MEKTRGGGEMMGKAQAGWGGVGRGGRWLERGVRGVVPLLSAALPLCRPAQRHRAATRSVRASVLFDLFNVWIWGDAGGSGRGTPALSWFLFQIQKVI